MQTTDISTNIANQLKTYAKFTVFNVLVFLINIVLTSLIITSYLF